MNSITTSELDISYDDIVIVSNMELEIKKGKITSIIGPNGCGKSTVLKSIGRILKPKKGIILLSGEDIKKLSTTEIAKKMAILPQTPTAPSGLTVSELVAYGRFPHQKGFGKLTPKDKEIINWALKVTKLTDYADREVDTLSGGQRQRVWIAMALAQQTDLILLDEPTTYLDMSHQMEVLELLYELNKTQGCTIVMVLHDLNLAARFSDIMIAMRDGKIIKQGSPNEVMNMDVLKEAFCIEAQIVEDKKSQRPICLTYDLIKV
jgi:iron complex transport system ATP-binding protein